MTPSPASPAITYSSSPRRASSSFFFFNDTATTEIYTLSLHDALPIFVGVLEPHRHARRLGALHGRRRRSEEHTSELQSQFHLVCRLLLEKKKRHRLVWRRRTSWCRRITPHACTPAIQVTC